MFITVWRFVVREGMTGAFEDHYGPDGTWARLFRSDPAYVRTDLYRSTTNGLEYVTVDTWRDAASYEAFRDRNAEEYRRIDRDMESLTSSEERLC